MYNIKIPKEIRDYKDKLIGGFTFRQIVSLVVAGGIGAPTYFKVNQLLGSDCAGWAVMIVGAPILAVGFWHTENMTLEKYAVKYFKFHFLYPKKRKYADNNIYKQIGKYQLAKKKNKGFLGGIVNAIQKNKAKVNGK